MEKLIAVICIIGATFAHPPSPECLKGPPGGKSPQECCKIPELIPQSVFDKCEASNPRTNQPQPGMPPKGCCMSECVLNTTGIMVNGVINKSAAVKYLSERLTGDAEAIKVVTAAVEHCNKEILAKKAEFDEMANEKLPAGEKVCNMMSGYMIGCVHGQAFKNCPKDKFGADAACDGIKSYVEKCGILNPMKVRG